MTASLDAHIRPAFSAFDTARVTPLSVARRLAAIPGLVEHLPLTGADRQWLQLPTDAGFAAWLIGWPPGARTGWHDHSGSAGAFVVIDGLLRESSVPAGGRTPVADDITVQRYAAGAGRAFPDHHVHDMANTSDAVAYSLHVYAPELAGMTRYAWEAGRLVTTLVETSDGW